MKKLILFGLLSLVIYACQQPSPAPAAPTTTTTTSTTTSCGPLGDCYTGTFVYDSTVVVTCPCPADTVMTGISFKFSYRRDTIFSNQNYIVYNLDTSGGLSLTYLKSDQLTRMLNFREPKFSICYGTFVLLTRSNKMIKFRKL